MKTIGRIRRSGLLMSWLLRRLGAVAITMPWRVVYVLPEHFDDEAVWIHEMEHLCQISRDGPIVFTVRYLWWLVRYGYGRNPYEIEARQREIYGATASDVKHGLKRSAVWIREGADGRLSP